MIAAGKLAADRNLHHGIAVGAGAAMDKIRDIKNAAPGSMRERAQWRRNVLDMANGDAPLSSPFSGAGDGGSDNGDSPMPSPSAPNPDVPTQTGGAGGASPIPTVRRKRFRWTLQLNRFQPTIKDRLRC